MPKLTLQDDTTNRMDTEKALTSSAVTYVFTGGGTGGHIYPGLAIADEVRSRNPQARIIYIGARGKMEAILVPKRGYPIHLVYAKGLPTKFGVKALVTFGIVNCIGILQSLIHLLRHRPQMIVATGGYASSPVLLAYKILNIFGLSKDWRCFVHEQNIVPGKVNKLAASIADLIGVTFEESLKYFPPRKGEWVGYPARKEIGSISREDARISLNLPTNAKVIFVFGASSGARSINRAIVKALPKLLTRNNIHVIHLTGDTKNTDYQAVKDTREYLVSLELSDEQISRYHQSHYSHEIHKLYAASDLVISRSSAGVIAEIGICGIPSILIPLPYAPGDHQAINAKILASNGAAYVIYESICHENGQIISIVNNEQLSDLALGILDNTNLHQTMSRQTKAALDAGGLQRIVDQKDDLLEDRNTPQKGLSVGDSREIDNSRHLNTPIPSAFALVQQFSKAYDRAFIDTVGAEYLMYRIDGFLKDSRWQIRNEGVKLVGLLGYRERLPFLLSILRDKTPAPIIQRCFGGDYKQVGFIRRNSVIAISKLGIYNESVRSTFLDLLTDPYYEVRTAVARAFAVLCPDTHDIDEELLNRLRCLLEDSSFEIRSAAIVAMGRVGDGRILTDLRPYYQDSNWQVREAILNTMSTLVRKDLIDDLVVLRKELDMILITCNHFDPNFPIKQALISLTDIINERMETS